MKTKQLSQAVQADLFGLLADIVEPVNKAKLPEHFSPGYYNTTNQKGKDLTRRNDRANWQSTNILKLFVKYKKLSPYQAQYFYRVEYFKDILITSVRRSFNTLANDKKIVRLDEKIATQFDGFEYTYKIKESV